MRILRTSANGPLATAISACRSHFLLAATLSALVNILYLAPTLYMMQVYDRVVPTGGLLTLFWITVVVAVAIATLTALEAVRARVMALAALRLSRKLSGAILDRLMARRKAEPGASSPAQAMREFDTFRQVLGGPPAIAMFDVPWTPIYFIVAFLIHPALGALVVVGGVILVVLAIANERGGRARVIESHRANAVAYGAQEASFREAEIIRALGMRQAIVGKHLSERRAGLEATTAVQFAAARYGGFVKFVRMFMQSLALGLGAWLAVKGEISVGAIIAASVLLSRALQPVEQLVAAWPAIGQARQALATIDTLFDGAPADARPPTALPEPEGNLRIERIHVREPAGPAMLLKNLSLELCPGEVLGVIGPSGAGKTTLARIAAGALSPDAGTVRIDEASFEDWDQEQLARHIGYLPQDIGLLSGTVGENISRFAQLRGRPPHLVDEEVVMAARMAGVHEMILHLPSGYDTVIGAPGSHRLSAGQAQRVGLARSFYGNPCILILDEPNSALDSDGEDALGRAVIAAKIRGAAIMIVSHRVGILGIADRLLVLQDGAACDYGPREDVLARIARRTPPNVVPLHERAGA